jgi:hypothetical protein
MAYTTSEIKGFAEKDLRISKLAITKSLIEKLPLEEIYEVGKITDLAEKYIVYIYKERRNVAKRGSVGDVADNTKHFVNWEQLAIGLNLAIPNAMNVKILNQVMDEYKQANKASANPKDVLTCCMQKFGTYPTKTGSVKKVVEQLGR